MPGAWSRRCACWRRSACPSPIPQNAMRRAPRCLLLAALLMIAYILLDALSCLLAALLLLFLALAVRGRAVESGERELF